MHSLGSNLSYQIISVSAGFRCHAVVRLDMSNWLDSCARSSGIFDERITHFQLQRNRENENSRNARLGEKGSGRKGPGDLSQFGRILTAFGAS